MYNSYESNLDFDEVFNQTDIIRKPISGYIQGYHKLPYILILPDDKNPSYSIEINGTIHVSPSILIQPNKIGESFGDIFDSETFDSELETKIFSFVYSKKNNVKLKNDNFSIKNINKKPKEHLESIHDRLLQEEDVNTGLIFGPKFQYYPISIDRFISEILDREFGR